MLFTVSTEWQKYETCESAAFLLDELDRCYENVTYLDLSRNTYSPLVFDKIAEIIKKMENLRSFKANSFLDTLTHDETMHVLSSLALSLPHSLVSLELSNNALSCEFPKEFERFISETPLAVLTLHDCGLGQDGADRIIRAIASNPDKSKLVSLNISKNRINKLPDEFGNIIGGFSNLQEINIRNNTIEQKSMALFFTDFNSETLHVLDIGDNFICGEAIKPFCNLISRMRLTRLYMHDIKIDGDEMDKVLDALYEMRSGDLPGGPSSNKPGLILDISYNDLEQCNVPRLTKLSDRFILKKLIIYENYFEDITDLRIMIAKDGGTLVDVESSPVDGVIPEAKEILQKISML